MFEKKVIVTDDALVIGQSRVLWNDIAELRVQDDPLLRKISNRFPRAEVFLKGGKVITISRSNKFQNQSSFVIDREEDIFQSIMELIKTKVPEPVTQSNAWFEWRLVLPAALIEVIILLGCVSARRSFEETVIAMISGGILGVIVGLVWERLARKKRYS
jgi:hypothetical protein